MPMLSTFAELLTKHYIYFRQVYDTLLCASRLSFLRPGYLLFFTQVFLAHDSKLRYNEVTEGLCQSESEAKICTETLTGTR